jgi:hypothetical protein
VSPLLVSCAIEKCLQITDMLLATVRLDSRQSSGSPVGHVLVDHLLDAPVIAPHKPRSTGKIKDAKCGDNDKMPEAESGEALINSAGRARDGLRCLRDVFCGGLNFVCVRECELMS